MLHKRDIHSISSFKSSIFSHNSNQKLEFAADFYYVESYSNQTTMSSGEGRQSPSPERSTGAQMNDTPGHGQGVNEQSNNKNESESQREVC
jgi:hypothetical protein